MNCIGNGTLLCALDDQTVKSLSLYGAPSFLSLEADLALPCQASDGICRHESSPNSVYDGRIKIVDSLHDGCLIRYVQSAKPLTFRLSIPSYCHRLWYPRCRINRKSFPSLLLSIPRGTQTPDGFCTLTEHRMLLTLLGECAFSENKEAILVNSGRCAILFVTGKEAELFSQAAKHISAYPFLEKDTQSTENAAWNTLCRLTSASGGTLASYEDPRIFLSDMSLVGNAFLQSGAIDRAKDTAHFLLSRLEKHGYLPLVMHALHPDLGTEETGNERVHYPEVCHFFLDLAEKAEPALANKLKNTVSLLFEKIRSTACFRFSGTEFSMRQGQLSASLQLHGNLVANAQYVHLAKRLGKSKLACVCALRNRLRSELSVTSLPKPYSADRLKNNRLSSVYGICPACEGSPYIGWLIRNDTNAYLCPECLANERAFTLQAPLLPGAYATCLEHSYIAGCITKEEFYTKVIKCCEYITDETSLYDLALLARILEDLDLKTHQTVFTKPQAPPNDGKFPLYAAEAAAYLLASKKSEMP